MLIIELNEFNPDLLKAAAERFNLSGLKKILGFKHARTWACEQEERYGLDPWVQWVSIHTGRPASEHQIRHLADADKLILPQVWEQLAADGIRYGVWGCMNAKYRPNTNCDFFFPDPWTFTEPAYPDKLNQFLSLPRYYAKNYLDIKPVALLMSLGQTSLYLLGSLPALFRVSGVICKSLFTTRLSTAFLFAYFDLVNAALFSAIRKRDRTEFCLIFLNSMAHYQHHVWPEDNRLTGRDRRFFEVINKVLEVLVSSRIDDEPVVVMNSFSQKNTASMGQTLYRQINPQIFFEKLQLPEFRLEQLMTNDSQLLFNSESDRKLAVDILESVVVDGKKAFQVDIHADNETSLFCQFIIWDSIPEDANITFSQGQTLEFFRYFEAVTRRTGSHVQEGDIFYTAMAMPDEMHNYEFSSVVLQHFGGKR